MRREKISDALTEINEKYIVEAANYSHKRKDSFRRWIPFAAGICILLGIGCFFKFGGIRSENSSISEDQSQVQMTEKGVLIPEMEIASEYLESAKAESTSDMVAFFIYEGRSYVQYEYIENAETLIGEKIGTANGTISEWTKEDGYVNGAGSVSGDFYTVNGYDSDFMLCMKQEQDAILTFINNNGFTIQKGYELFEERLHLKDTYVSVYCQERNDWNNGVDVSVQIQEKDFDIIDQFLTRIDDAEFMLLSDIPLDDDSNNVYDSKELYHIYFTSENGMVTHLRLFEGGYVSFNGISQICVQIDQTFFEDFIQILKY